MAHPHEAIPTLRVSDALAAAAWYARLGFVEDWRHQHGPGLPWFISISTPEGATLFLTEHEGDCSPRGNVFLVTHDIASAEAALQTTAQVMPWGDRELSVLDPDGNRVRISQPQPRLPALGSTMLEGTCLCGAVRWTLSQMPPSATACSCTACRRYGTLWAYGWENEDISLHGETAAFVRADALSFNFCPTCGNVSHWRGLKLDEQGRRRVAVNLRLTEPGPIADVPIRHFDGLDTWSNRPEDGKCVKDLWF